MWAGGGGERRKGGKGGGGGGEGGGGGGASFGGGKGGGGGGGEGGGKGGKFRFDAEKRNTVREALGINDHLVIGTVGNLDPVKNQKYLLEIFASIHKIRQDVTLVIVGEGSTFKRIKGPGKDIGGGKQHNVFRGDGLMLIRY